MGKIKPLNLVGTPIKAFDALSGLAMSSVSSDAGWGYDYIDTQKDDEDKIIAQYDKALEIETQVDKVTQYAKNNDLDIQKTLESFFTEEELELYENLTKLRNSVMAIEATRKMQKEQEEKNTKEYLKTKKNTPAIPAIPWIPNLPGTGDAPFDETMYIKSYCQNRPKLHNVTI